MASEEKQLKWFGRRLSLARKERGLSQAQLAKRLYVGQATVSRLEQGTAVPDVATIHQIAEVLLSGMAAKCRIYAGFGTR